MRAGRRGRVCLLIGGSHAKDRIVGVVRGARRGLELGVLPGGGAGARAAHERAGARDGWSRHRRSRRPLRRVRLVRRRRVRRLLSGVRSGLRDDTASAPASAPASASAGRLRRAERDGMPLARRVHAELRGVVRLRLSTGRARHRLRGLSGVVLSVRGVRAVLRATAAASSSAAAAAAAGAGTGLRELLKRAPLPASAP